MSLEGTAEGKTLVGSINKCDTLTISAYGIAVKNGFEGTEAEWLASLKGEPGKGGNDGVGIKYVRQVLLSLEDDGTNVIEIGLTNGSVAHFDIKNGSKGSTPVKGVDYYNEADKAEMVNSVLEALPTWEGGSY